MNPGLAVTSNNFALTQTNGGVTVLNSPYDTRINTNSVIYMRCINSVIYHYKLFASSSDSRLKFNQRPIYNALATITSMQPRIYETK